MNPTEAFLSSYPLTTRNTYARVLVDFVAKARARVDTATQDDVARYAAAIGDQAVTTQATKINVLASFFAFMQKTGKRTDNPMVVIAHRPRVDKAGSVKWLDEAEQRALLSAESDEAHAARNKAILWILLHGLRLAELVSLDVEDYRYGELRFTGKGSKSRIVPLVAPAQGALDAYLGPRRSGPLFRVAKHRISGRQVQRIVNDATERIGKRLHPHGLRHSTATRLIRAGVGLPQLQKYLGHAALSSTQIYMHLNVDDVREEMKKDPLAESPRLTVIEGGERVAG